jgi:hypothetical protein
MRSLFLFLVLLCSLPALADDLTVGWISRQPDIDYVWNSSNPRVDGWPAAGANVSWRAHVRNFGAARTNVPYRWLLDGTTMSTGDVDLAADATTTIDMPWQWTFDRHRVAFEIDPGNVVAEESEANNELEVFTDALSVGFWVEQSVYDFFRAHQHELGIGSTSWENWAQRQIGFFNDMAALAVYPETPDGVLDRLRIQKIVIVPDDTLPMAPIPNYLAHDGEPNGSTHPNMTDRTVDLMWGFRAAALEQFYDPRPIPANQYYLAPVLLHELGHARSLVDVYAWNVRHAPPAFVIGITENGQPVTGRYLPVDYKTPEQGFMNEHLTFIDRYSAIVLNRMAGHRATRGNYNDPENYGSFLNDFPAQNRLTILDGARQPIANATVAIYQSVSNVQAWYTTNYDDQADLMLQTDASGQVLVGRNPFAANRPVSLYFGGTNGAVLVRVEKDGALLGFAYLESRLFNLAYWRGDTIFADHELVIGPGPMSCGFIKPFLLSPGWDETVSATTVLRWEAMPGATEYNVWASAELGTPRLIGTTTSTSLPVHLRGRVYWWVEAATASCAPRRSDTSRYSGEGALRRRAVRR